jgi:hypothetical protein
MSQPIPLETQRIREPEITARPDQPDVESALKIKTDTPIPIPTLGPGTF